MNIKTEFILYAKDFPVMEVYNEIGLCGVKTISAERSYKNLSGESITIPKESSIVYSHEEIKTLCVEESLKKLYSILKPRGEIIQNLIEKYNLNSQFCIVLNITENPEILIPQYFLQMAVKLNSSIVFDTYLDIDKTIEYDDMDSLEEN